MRLQPSSFARPCLLAVLLAAGTAAAQPGLAGLTELSLEQLSSIEVTSVGKRVQRLADVPGSVYVIQQEDIRRSGAVSLPEVLRLAPNLHVARADANRWAITARGFSSVLANKMLVLIDGRTVYSPLFSGVFWEAQELLLDDIERIEVLSGAGGTLYGSNAVNGVINIITRSAGETGGALAKVVAGNQARLVAARYGSGAPNGAPWRLYAMHAERDATVLGSGASAGDAGRHQQAGFRSDLVRGPDQLTVQGDIYGAEIDQPMAARELAGANLLARWTRHHGAGHRTQLQTWVDHSERLQPGLIDDRLATLEIELQQTRRPAPGHELLWGAGYRWYHDRLVNLDPPALQFLPPERRLHLADVFVQHEFPLADDLRGTLGIKAEHNGYTGLEWLPTAKLAWHPAPWHLLWATASRTVRTPSRVDRDVVLPALPAGGSRFVSEVARVYELGWRAQPRTAVSFALTLFHHDFDRLRSVDALPAGPGFGNSYRGTLSGLETWVRWRATERWRLNAGYGHQRLRLAARPEAAVLPVTESQLANDPRNRWVLGVGWDPRKDMELDLHLRHVGRLPNPAVPAYTALDLRWGWRLRPDLELSLVARNLTDKRRPEWGSPAMRSEIPRSFHARLVWRP